MLVALLNQQALGKKKKRKKEQPSPNLIAENAADQDLLIVTFILSPEDRGSQAPKHYLVATLTLSKYF